MFQPGPASPVKVMARCHKSASQSVPTGNFFTVINFDVVDYDDFGAITTGAGWSFTAPVSGLYSVDVSLFGNDRSWGGNASSMTGHLFKNGVQQNADLMLISWAQNWTPSLPYSAHIYLDADDVLDFRIDQWSGGPLVFDSTRGDFTYFSICYLGAR